MGITFFVSNEMSIITRKFKLGMIATALAMTAVVTVSYAFAASNTVPDSTAGQGTSVVSGYTASNIQYTPNTSDPTKLDKVEFDVNNPPMATAKIYVQLVTPGGTWFDNTKCTISTGTHITCDTTATPPNVSAINELNLVITDY